MAIELNITHLLIGTAQAVLEQAVDPNGMSVPVEESRKWLGALCELAYIGADAVRTQEGESIVGPS